MSSTNVQTSKDTDSSTSPKAAAYAGLKVPPPSWKLAADVPEYHEWVKQGGLDNFAKRHGLDAGFVNMMHKVPPMTMFEFEDELAKIPAVYQYIQAITKAWEKTFVPFSRAEVNEIMRIAEGWSSDDDDGQEALSEASASEIVSQETQPQDPTKQHKECLAWY
jgi:hypothetical protein